MVTTAGTVKLTFLNGGTVSVYMDPARGVYPFAVSLVWATGTDHTTGIMGLY
jgi:hypothetical protein